MSLATFFQDYNLYEELLLVDNYSDGNEKFYNPIHFNKTTYEGFCELEEKPTTFEIIIEKYAQHQIEENSYSISDKYLKDSKIDYIFMCRGNCKSCNNYHITYTLYVYSNNKIPKDIKIFAGPPGANWNTKKFEPETKIFVQKIGIYPAVKPKIDSRVTKHFTRESKMWYFKGIDLLNKGYGMGAYAYFRRIIENELINIIEQIKNLPDSHESEIANLLDEYKKHPKTSTIYQNIYKHLPTSLKSLGVNPIKVLYNQTSEGLHSLSEEECLIRAKSIAQILNFTLLKIYEEKSELQSVKNAIKALNL